jgi:single-strand DNA-binding protein
MARGVNKVILVGNLGNDPEIKYTQGGMAVATCSLATSSVRKDKDGEQVEKTEWHRVKFFGKLAEIVEEYCKKGQQIYVEGSIRYDKYTGSDGVEKYFTDIIGDQMLLLGGKREEGERQQAPRRSGPGRDEHGQRTGRRDQGGNAPQGQATAPPARNDEYPDDDIPF